MASVRSPVYRPPAPEAVEPSALGFAPLCLPATAIHPGLSQREVQNLGAGRCYNPSPVRPLTTFGSVKMSGAENLKRTTHDGCREKENGDAALQKYACEGSWGTT